MNNSKYNEFYESAISALNKYLIESPLQEAIDFFEENDAEAPALASFRTLSSALNQLQNSLKEGTDLNIYQEKLDQIYRETWQLFDQLRWERSEHKPMIFAVDDLLAELDPQHLATINDYQLECVFNTIRTTYPIGKAQRTALHQAILSDEVPMYLRATLLSAMTLNVLEWFDADLLECMYTYTLDDQPAQLRQQSWTALFLCGMVHDKRIMHYPRLREEYLLLCEIEPAQLEQLQKLLLPLREYKSFRRDLHQLLDNIQQSKINNAEDEEQSEEQRLEITQDSDNFKKLMELMRSNVDMGYSQFKYTSKLGFFAMEGTDHHWLMPFDSECEIIKKALEETPVLNSWYQLLLHNQAQTNTDKYATFLMMASLPDRVKDLNQKLSLPEGKMADLGNDMIMQIHLQDLYRFFTLSKTGKSLKNPFDLSPDLSSYQCFGSAFHTADNLRTVGEYLLKAEKYDDAAHTYDRLLEIEMNEKNLKNAIRCMRFSEDFKDVKVKSYMLLYIKYYPPAKEIFEELFSQYDMTDPLLEPYYKEALEAFPNDTDYLTYYGVLLNNSKRYAEALNPLYKAFMINENGSILTVEELVKAHVKLGQFDKARSLFSRLAIPDDSTYLLNQIVNKKRL